MELATQTSDLVNSCNLCVTFHPQVLANVCSANLKLEDKAKQRHKACSLFTGIYYILI